MVDRKRVRNVKEIKRKLQKFTTLNELITHDSGTYQYIKRHKLTYLIKHLLKYNKIPQH